MSDLRLSFSLVLALGCAAPAARAETPSLPPRRANESRPTVGQLDALSAREAKALGTQAFTWNGRRFEVESSSPVSVEAQEDVTLFTLSLGTETPVFCRLYSEPYPTGMLLSQLARGEGRKVVRASVLDVTAIREQPALFFEAFAVRTKETAVEVRKVAVVRTPEGALACMHGEPGFRRTFQRIVTRLARALLEAEPRPTSRFV